MHGCEAVECEHQLQGGGELRARGGGAPSMSYIVGVTRSSFFLVANLHSQHQNGYAAVQGVVGSPLQD